MPLEYVQSLPREAALEYPNGGVVDAVDWRRPAAAGCLARTIRERVEEKARSVRRREGLLRGLRVHAAIPGPRGAAAAGAVFAPGHTAGAPLNLAFFGADACLRTARVFCPHAESESTVNHPAKRGIPVVQPHADDPHLDNHPTSSLSSRPEGRLPEVENRGFRVSPPVVLQGHGARVGHVAWSACGGYVCSSSDDGVVLLWSVVTGAAVTQLQGAKSDPVDGVSAPVAWSPCNGVVVAADARGLLLWDRGTVTCDVVGKAGFSEKKTMALGASGIPYHPPRAVARVPEMFEGRMEGRTSRNRGFITVLSFLRPSSGDDSILACACADGSCRVYRVWVERAKPSYKTRSLRHHALRDALSQRVPCAEPLAVARHCDNHPVSCLAAKQCSAGFLTAAGASLLVWSSQDPAPRQQVQLSISRKGRAIAAAKFAEGDALVLALVPREEVVFAFSVAGEPSILAAYATGPSVGSLDVGPGCFMLAQPGTTWLACLCDIAQLQPRLNRAEHPPLAPCKRTAVSKKTGSLPAVTTDLHAAGKQQACPTTGKRQACGTLAADAHPLKTDAAVTQDETDPKEDECAHNACEPGEQEAGVPAKEEKPPNNAEDPGKREACPNTAANAKEASAHTVYEDEPCATALNTVGKEEEHSTGAEDPGKQEACPITATNAKEASAHTVWNDAPNAAGKERERSNDAEDPGKREVCAITATNAKEASNHTGWNNARHAAGKEEGSSTATNEDPGSASGSAGRKKDPRATPAALSGRLPSELPADDNIGSGTSPAVASFVVTSPVMTSPVLTSPGSSVCSPKRSVRFDESPTFAPLAVKAAEASATDEKLSLTCQAGDAMVLSEHGSDLGSDAKCTAASLANNTDENLPATAGNAASGGALLAARPAMGTLAPLKNTPRRDARKDRRDASRTAGNTFALRVDSRGFDQAKQTQARAATRLEDASTSSLRVDSRGLDQAKQTQARAAMRLEDASTSSLRVAMRPEDASTSSLRVDSRSLDQAKQTQARAAMRLEDASTSSLRVDSRGFDQAKQTQARAAMRLEDASTSSLRVDSRGLDQAKQTQARAAMRLEDASTSSLRVDSRGLDQAKQTQARAAMRPEDAGASSLSSSSNSASSGSPPAAPVSRLPLACALCGVGQEEPTGGCAHGGVRHVFAPNPPDLTAAGLWRLTVDALVHPATESPRRGCRAAPPVPRCQQVVADFWAAFNDTTRARLYGDPHFREKSGVLLSTLSTSENASDGRLTP
ncbi:hypothetical protein DIPPA_25067 [Diplonema papillatum]|nr:hypothetical protein DIPPA_25067 [Diplonema papillatum]